MEEKLMHGNFLNDQRMVFARIRRRISRERNGCSKRSAKAKRVFLKEKFDEVWEEIKRARRAKKSEISVVVTKNPLGNRSRFTKDLKRLLVDGDKRLHAVIVEKERPELSVDCRHRPLRYHKTMFETTLYVSW